MTTTRCRAGDLLRVGRAASVQFTKPILFRVIRVLDRSRNTYHGWIWLEGYEINDKGDAVVRRSIFVQVAGLRTAPEPTAGRQPGRKVTPRRRVRT